LDTDDFGQQLREARLKRGHTIEEIARRTKIPAPTLERLESGERSALPADVFVCGFLRAYAREVGLDGEEAVARFRRQPKAPEGREARDPSYASITITQDEEQVAAASPSAGLGARLDALIAAMTSRIPMLEDALGRKPAFALVVLLVVLVATLTLSLLLGGDPTPGRGLS
jgi:cytoskeletal protein RodZ